MTDRIDKIRLASPEALDAYEVEAMRDALDEEKNNQQQFEEEDEEFQNAFHETDRKTPSQLRAPQISANIQEIALNEISKAWFHSIDLKTEPSSLYLKIKMRFSNDLLLVKMRVPRGLALSFKSQTGNKAVNLNQHFKDSKIWVHVIQNLSESEEEITRISTADDQKIKIEKTLSQTFKLRQDLSFWKRIGVVEPESSKFNLEVILAYLIAFIVCLFLFFGIFYLST